jgi:hypothetical protein
MRPNRQNTDEHQDDDDNNKKCVRDLKSPLLQRVFRTSDRVL